MSARSRKRRDHARSVRHGLRKARAKPAHDVLERDRQDARAWEDQYGCIDISPPFYLRHLGLNDVHRGGPDDS